MKLIKKIIFMIFLLFIIISCGKKETPKPNIVKSSINVFLRGEPTSLDPSLAHGNFSFDILINTMEGLTRASNSGSSSFSKGAGASSWEVSKDGKEWIFHLRDYSWEDGKRVTAYDYVYGITRTLDSKTASPMAYLLFPIKNAEEFNEGKVSSKQIGVKALDDKTLSITLSHETPYFLELTYLPVMFPQREDIVKKFKDSYGSSTKTFLGNGPFKIKEWNHENKIILEKNIHYWDSNSIFINKVNLFIISDENVRMDMLLKKKVDIAEASKKEWAKKIIESNEFYKYPSYSASTNFLFFNSNNKYFKNKNIRIAFSLGIKREEMSDLIYRGLYPPAYALVPPRINVGNSEYRNSLKDNLLPSSTKNPRELLIKGLEELGINKTPNELTFTFSNPSTSPWARSYSEYLANMYKETLGINVKSEFLNWPLFIKKVKNKNYEFGGMAWIADYNDPSSFLESFTSDSGVSPISWNSQKYDLLLEKARKSSNPKQRFKCFMEAESLLLEDGWITPTTYIKENIFISNNIQDYFQGPFNGRDFKNITIVNNQ